MSTVKFILHALGLIFTNVSLMSASQVKIHWTQSVQTHSCVVYYKQADGGNETSFHITTPMQANISNLTVNATYYINILCNSSSFALFFPSPIEVILSSEHSLLQFTTNMHFVILCVCQLQVQVLSGM